MDTLFEHADFELVEDPRARSRAVARRSLDAGRNVLVEAPLAVAVHSSHKGRRCDECLRALDDLHRCSGCGFYWYCGTTCQSVSWKRHHRRLCSFTKSRVSRDNTDVFLLSHLAAEHFYKFKTLEQIRASSPHPSVHTFWDLLESNQPHVGQGMDVGFSSSAVLCAAAARFGNNNFVVHDARLGPYAHGVFAVASRSFNHSCRPNAVAMFEESKRGIHMVVKLVTSVVCGDEICVSYTDPAARDCDRRDALLHAYGFVCRCPRCVCGTSGTPLSPSDEHFLHDQMVAVVRAQLRNPTSTLETIRDALAPMIPFTDALLGWLPRWTAEFSASSHDGPFDQALDDGNAILSVYLLVYPGSHPLLELHCLELCKVAWNMYLTSVKPGSADPLDLKRNSGTYLHWAKRLADRNSEGLAESRCAISAEYCTLDQCLSP